MQSSGFQDHPGNHILLAIISTNCKSIAFNRPPRSVIWTSHVASHPWQYLKPTPLLHRRHQPRIKNNHISVLETAFFHVHRTGTPQNKLRTTKRSCRMIFTSSELPFRLATVPEASRTCRASRRATRSGSAWEGYISSGIDSFNVSDQII